MRIAARRRYSITASAWMARNWCSSTQCSDRSSSPAVAWVIDRSARFWNLEPQACKRGHVQGIGADTIANGVTDRTVIAAPTTARRDRGRDSAEHVEDRAEVVHAQHHARALWHPIRNRVSASSSMARARFPGRTGGDPPTTFYCASLASHGRRARMRPASSSSGAPQPEHEEEGRTKCPGP